MDIREERAEDYRHRLRCDFEALFRDYGVVESADSALLEDLVDTAMHPIEHLLIEVTS